MTDKHEYSTVGKESTQPGASSFGFQTVSVLVSQGMWKQPSKSKVKGQNNLHKKKSGHISLQSKLNDHTRTDVQFEETSIKPTENERTTSPLTLNNDKLRDSNISDDDLVLTNNEQLVEEECSQKTIEDSPSDNLIISEHLTSISETIPRSFVLNDEELSDSVGRVSASVEQCIQENTPLDPMSASSNFCLLNNEVKPCIKSQQFGRLNADYESKCAGSSSMQNTDDICLPDLTNR